MSVRSSWTVRYLCIARSRSIEMCKATRTYEARKRGHSSVFSSVLVALLAAPLFLGCFRIPEGQSTVEKFEVEGESALSETELEKSLATRQSRKLLGLFRGVFFDHELYNHHVLQVDIQRVERIYRSHGYYQARVVSSRVFFRDERHVRVVLRVDEGEPTRVATLALEGLPAVSASERRRLAATVKKRVGKSKIFREKEFQEAGDQLLYVLRDIGFARAKVERLARVDVIDRAAHLEFVVTPGNESVYGPITIKGLSDGIPENKVRDALQLKEGQQYSQSDLEDAQNALMALGAFSSVRIEPKLDDSSDGDKAAPDAPEKEDESDREVQGNDPVVPILVVTKPTALRTFELGGGSQLDVVRAAVHGKIGFRHGNFLGGLRRFRTHLRPGVAFYPTRLQNIEPPTDYLPFVNAEVELIEPGFLEARTEGVVAGELDAYPLLLSPHVDREAPVLGYLQEEGRVGVQRAFGSHLFLAPRYSITFAQPFAYRGQLDPDLRPLTISAVELYGRYDTRDDLLFPTRGFAASAAIQYAGGPLGGQVEDVRVSPEIRGFVPLAKHWTLAMRAGTGLLFPINWGDATASESGGPVAGTSRAAWVRDTQIGLFRSLFAGGPNSNRGYGQQGIGPHGVVPFFVPNLQGPEVAEGCESDPESDPANCLLPLGGRTKWEATVEVRFPIRGDLYGATFCDAADVAPRFFQYRFDRLHLSCGLGARYNTPVGPLRFDVGYRIPGLQTLGSDEGEGVPPSLFGVPVALAFSIGEAF